MILIILKLLLKKITTQEEFDKIFGMASVMGEDGAPDKIDFSKQYVLVIIGKVSNKYSTIKINKLQRNHIEIMLYYTLKSGKEQDYSIRDSKIVQISNQYQGHVQFIKQ